MSQGKKIRMDEPARGVEMALLEDDYASARKAMAIRLAHMFDNTDSARDVKAISMSLAPLIERCEADAQVVADAEEDTPLNRIMSMAEDA